MFECKSWFDIFSNGSEIPEILYLSEAELVIWKRKSKTTSYSFSVQSRSNRPRIYLRIFTIKGVFLLQLIQDDEENSATGGSMGAGYNSWFYLKLTWNGNFLVVHFQLVQLNTSRHFDKADSHKDYEPETWQWLTQIMCGYNRRTNWQINLSTICWMPRTTR